MKGQTVPNHRRNLSKQSLWDQVSAKFTPEICINNDASYNRLRAADRQATVADTSELSPDSFFFLFIPTFDERTTGLHLEAEKLTETVLHLNLGHLVGLFF
jgi:hypothetical protein